MKKLTSFLVIVLCCFLFIVPASAEQDVNLMSSYDKIPWEGDTVYYEAGHGTLSFRGEGGKASVEFQTENALGMYFYFDIGSKHNEGIGCAELEFIDDNDKVISVYTTEKIIGNGSFNRYKLGNNEEYLHVPENADKVRITIFYTGGEKSPYFRNFGLYFSNGMTVNSSLDWEVSGKLEIVQVGVTNQQHIMWVVIIFLVAGTFVLIRKRRDSLRAVRRK